MPKQHPDPRPQHRQIAAEMRALILSGDMAPESRLPSVRELMETHGVVNQTVQRALKLLKDEGLISGKAGAGCFRSRDDSAGHRPHLVHGTSRGRRRVQLDYRGRQPAATRQ